MSLVVLAEESFFHYRERTVDVGGLHHHVGRKKRVESKGKRYYSV